MAATLAGLRWDAVRLSKRPRNTAPLAALFSLPHRWGFATNWVRGVEGLVIEPADAPAYVISARMLSDSDYDDPPPDAVAWVRMMDSHDYGGFLWRREFVILWHQTKVEPIGEHEIDPDRVPLWLAMADRARARQMFDHDAVALEQMPLHGYIDRWSLRAMQHRGVRRAGAGVRINRTRWVLDRDRALHSLAGFTGVVLAGGMVYLLCTPSRRALDPNTCQACGYNREGLADQPCPECGAEPTTAQT
ncbi:MAG: hypothetical protein AAF138_10200 [Planctomycetota bacterium]